MTEHALLSASGASRWLRCTPSARLEEIIPNKTSSYAREGTFAHALAELTVNYWLNNISEMDFENQRDKLISSETGKEFYNAEMQEYINDYAHLIISKVNSAKEICEDTFAELEVKIDFSKWVPQGFGTSDCIIVSDNTLEIIDLKYGKRHRVEAKENPQMKLYALGALEYYGSLYDIEKIRMTIFQPRLSGEQSSDEIMVTELLKWAEEVIKPKAKEAFEGTGEFTPSEEACRFCRAKEKCKARFEYNLKLFDEAPEPRLITPSEAAKVLDKAEDIKTWLEDLESLVMSALMKGEKVKGYKIVEGRSNRTFADESKVVKAMKKAGYKETVLYEKKLIPLTQMEKDFGKKEVAEILKDLIVKPKGKPKLAPESDKRPEMQLDETIIAAFDGE